MRRSRYVVLAVKGECLTILNEGAGTGPNVMEAKMRKILSSLAAGAALLGAGYAFEANATMGVAFQGLK